MVTAIRFTGNNACRMLLLALLAGIWCIDYTSNEDFSFCVFRLLFHRHCYACGTLRGIAAFLHGDLRSAIALNPLNIATLPVLGWVFVNAWKKNRI